MVVHLDSISSFKGRAAFDDLFSPLGARMRIRRRLL